jgi:A/G-specific adenine glycosylase
MGENSPSARTLLDWYDHNRRILPWREDPTPYHVWLSEIMLQQTRVEAAQGYYERFLRELPDISSLAAAEEDRCLKLWEGLGYYSRIRNMRKAAGQIMEEYGGTMPSEPSELVKLPGIGRYTAAAIASIAFGEKAAAVDGNLLRIFARLTAYAENSRTDDCKNAAEQYFLSLMDAEETAADHEGIVSDASEASSKSVSASQKNVFGSFNQALMDLGATVCLPNTQPACDRCPWQDDCLAHKCGQETDFPVIEPKKARRIENRTVLVIRDEDRTVLHKRPEYGLLAGLYELPNTEGHLDEKEALQYVRSLGFEPLRIRALGEAKHIFSHIEWHMIGYAVKTDELQLEDRNIHSLQSSGTVDMLNEATLPADTQEKDSDGYILVRSREAREHYAIPSAFSFYASYVNIKDAGHIKKAAPGTGKTKRNKK